jgi:hypothetical protein
VELAAEGEPSVPVELAAEGEPSVSVELAAEGEPTQALPKNVEITAPTERGRLPPPPPPPPRRRWPIGVADE